MRVWHRRAHPLLSGPGRGRGRDRLVLRNMFVAAHRRRWLVACTIVALLIDPLVDVVDRLLPRWLSVIVVLARRPRHRRRGHDRPRQRPARFSRRPADHGARGRGRAWRNASTGPWTSASPTGCRRSSTSWTIGSTTTRSPCRRDHADIRRDRGPDAVPLGLRPALLRHLRQSVPARTAGRPPQVATARCVRGRRYLLIALAHSLVNGVVVGLLCWALTCGGTRPRSRRRRVHDPSTDRRARRRRPTMLLAFGWREGGPGSSCSPRCWRCRPSRR